MGALYPMWANTLLRKALPSGCRDGSREETQGRPQSYKMRGRYPLFCRALEKNALVCYTIHKWGGSHGSTGVSTASKPPWPASQYLLFLICKASRNAAKNGGMGLARDAFTGGVEPGGLWNQNDIRVLICYVLDSVAAPLSREDIARLLQQKGLANYFEVGDALAALERLGHISQDGEGLCSIRETGREIARTLASSLPLSVRDKAREAALMLLADARTQRENRVDIQEDGERGCRVCCHISGGAMDLMTLSLYVPDRAQAELVRANFHRDPEGAYRLLLSFLTGDEAYAREFFARPDKNP